MSFQLEICCFNFASAMLAQQTGATRIELCADAAEGGTTPNYGTIQLAREQLSIQLYPIIRPRGGDFFYTSEELEIIKRDILVCKELGCDGVVIGMLHHNGSIDIENTKRLVALAYPMGVTFHRAFDRASQPMEALEAIISTGCERILSSGQQTEAMLGAGLLHDLIAQAEGRIVIMPGSGVKSSNIIELATITGATEFHASARVNEPSAMEYINENMRESLSTVMVNANEVALMKEQLNQYFEIRN